MLKRQHDHEQNVKRLLDKHNIEYRYVSRGEDTDTSLVPDFLLPSPTHTVALEVDEQQHKMQTHSETERMRHIARAIPGVRVFIRYNPDAYIGTKTTMSKKCATLLDVIHTATHTSYNDVRVVKLFFDGYTTPSFDKL